MQQVDTVVNQTAHQVDAVFNHTVLFEWFPEGAGARRAVLLVRRFRCGRGGEFLEARIVAQRIEHRIEHRIEPEQCGVSAEVVRKVFALLFRRE